MKLILTQGEKNHLLGLLLVNEREGWYYSPKNQYLKRHKRLKEKLEAL